MSDLAVTVGGDLTGARNKRKRRRLSRVVDKLAEQAGGLLLENNNRGLNNNVEPKRELASPEPCACPHRDCCSPASPLTPTSLPPEDVPHYFHIPELFRRRSRSDTDLSPWSQAADADFVLKDYGGVRKHEKIEDTNPFPQVAPLDLSVRGNPPCSDRRVTSCSPAFNVSPVVETMPPGADVAFACSECGQLFSLRDRLAKHVASCHKRRAIKPGSRAYVCAVCGRPFARSDMLTRHTRLHTGAKPYECRTCGQVFSRSDHLSTHQRTHTGEKPYRCPQCLYAACRRDMITRHMRTHARDPLQLHREPNIQDTKRQRSD